MSLGGADYQLRSGDYTACIAQVGGGLRQLRHRDRDLVLSYGADEVRPWYRGSLIAPWPNRVVDGRYSFDGTTYQLAISEPERNHALHGLVSWSRFDLLEHTSSSVVLGHRIVPQTGYPFQVELVARYFLDDSGLTCSVSAQNNGAERAPFGLASHPYLVAGAGVLDEWTLDLPAGQVLQVSADRLVPQGLAPVEDGDFDFRDGRMLEATEVDHAFTALTPDSEGRARVRLLAAAGLGVECDWDAVALPWVQVHTADLPDRATSRLGLALEPMTCPPDAFNSGTDLVVLAPGDRTEADWSIRAI